MLHGVQSIQCTCNFDSMPQGLVRLFQRMTLLSGFNVFRTNYPVHAVYV